MYVFTCCNIRKEIQQSTREQSYKLTTEIQQSAQEQTYRIRTGIQQNTHEQTNCFFVYET